MKTKKNTETTQYGAAEIKQVYQSNFRKGLEYAVILHVVLVCSYLLISYVNNLNAAVIKNEPYHPREVNISEPPSVNENDNQVPRQEQEIVKPIKEMGALIPEPVAKEKAEQMTIKTQEQLDKINTDVSREGDSVKYVADNGNSNNIIEHINKNDIKVTHNDNPDIIYKSFEVEVVPECVNLDAIKNSMVYPIVAIESNIEGRVSIKVLVGPDGHVIQTGALTGPEVFYDEVRDKAKNLEFTSGLQNGKAVKVWMTVPFNFKLKDK